MNAFLNAVRQKQDWTLPSVEGIYFFSVYFLVVREKSVRASTSSPSRHRPEALQVVPAEELRVFVVVLLLAIVVVPLVKVACGLLEVDERGRTGEVVIIVRGGQPWTGQVRRASTAQNQQLETNGSATGSRSRFTRLNHDGENEKSLVGGHDE